ncbi:MAG: hypothetical protein OXC40_02705 [Proteobacteria bacterium]|nr:hypothetical protein [Pseudomonadota bacterium]
MKATQHLLILALITSGCGNEVITVERLEQTDEFAWSAGFFTSMGDYITEEFTNEDLVNEDDTSSPEFTRHVSIYMSYAQKCLAVAQNSVLPEERLPEYFKLHNVIDKLTSFYIDLEEGDMKEQDGPVTQFKEFHKQLSDLCGPKSTLFS